MSVKKLSLFVAHFQFQRSSLDITKAVLRSNDERRSEIHEQRSRGQQSKRWISITSNSFIAISVDPASRLNADWLIVVFYIVVLLSLCDANAMILDTLVLNIATYYLSYYYLVDCTRQINSS